MSAGIFETRPLLGRPHGYPGAGLRITALLSNRLVRAERLDGSLYAEVKADGTATGQALVVVAVVALATVSAGLFADCASGGIRRAVPYSGWWARSHSS